MASHAETSFNTGQRRLLHFLIRWTQTQTILKLNNCLVIMHQQKDVTSQRRRPSSTEL